MQGLVAAVLVGVATRKVGALGDVLGVVGGVGEHARVIRCIHTHPVLVDGISQRLGKLIGATAPVPLVCDDRRGTPPVKRNGVVVHVQEVSVLAGDVLGTQATTLLASMEHIRTGHTSVNHLQHDPCTSGIVCTQRLLVILEVALLGAVVAYALHTWASVHCVCVTREHHP